MLKASWIKSSLFLGATFIILGVIIVFIFKALNLNSLQFFLNMKIFIEKYGFIGVFLATILAGTIVPLGSPGLVIIASSFGLHPIFLALTATIGFTIGMTINYLLAYILGEAYIMRKIGEERFKEVSSLWMKKGWILYTIFGFIPSLPIELLSFFCGFLKMRFDIFLALTFITRLIVFIVLAYFGSQLGGWIKII
jgi:membrane protein YqaA with SNARE-associated domain